VIFWGPWLMIKTQLKAIAFPAMKMTRLMEIVASRQALKIV
jgi:hypothetical protein